MYKIDVKDKKILYYLSVNSRLSYIQLGMKVGLSENAVKTRIQRLIEKKIISHFSAVVNSSSMGYTTFTLILSTNEDVYESKDFLDYFKNHSFSIWVVTLSGGKDLFVEFVAKDFTHQIEILEEMRKDVGSRIVSYECYLSKLTLRVEHLIKDVYSGINIPNIEIKERSHKNSIKIDLLDRRILREIVKDSSKKLIDLSRDVKASVDSVRYHMKKLEKEGVILKYFSEVIMKNIGYTGYLCKVKMQNIDSKRFKEICNEIGGNEFVSYAFVDISNSTIIFVFCARETEQIDCFIRKIRKNYNENINDFEYYLIKENIKLELFPEGLAEEG